MDKNHKQTSFQTGRDWKDLSVFTLALYLFILVASVYSLTYSGTFITDDEHILSSRTLSLAFDNSPNDTRVYGNSRVFSLSNLPEISAVQALNIEPGLEILATPLARLAAILQVGRIQSLFLFNIGVTALTAVILFLIVLMLGCSIPVAFMLSLFFGFGTLAWPYTRTFFRDPLAMLFMALAWSCSQLIISKNENFQSHLKKSLLWNGLVLFLVAGVLTKNTIVLAMPVILLDIVINKASSKTKNNLSFNLVLQQIWNKYRYVIGFIVLLLIVWLIFLPRIDLFARLSTSYYFSLIQFFIAAPHPNFLQAIAGPFISPGKSIFLYSPILILSIFSLISNSRSAWSAWAYLGLLVTAQALFYDANWWGSINWGLRFTLPAVPPLMIAAAPVVEDWLRSARGRLGLAFLGSISALVQLIGILPPIHGYYNEISSLSLSISNSASLWSINYSPLLWNLKWILSGGNMDLAISRIGVPAVPIVMAWIGLILLVLLGLRRIKQRWFPLALICLCSAVTVFMLATYINDPAFYRSRKDLEAAQEKISQGYQSGDLILIKSYGSPVWYFMMNWGLPDLPWTSLSFYYPSPNLVDKFISTQNPEVALDEITLSLLRKIPGSYRRVWIVLPDDSPGADLNLEIDWLGINSSSSDHWFFAGDQVVTRLYLFNLKPVANQYYEPAALFP